MWNFLLGLFIGDALRKASFGPFARLFMKLVIIGILIAGLIYTYVVFKAVSERSHAPYVHAHSTH
jgi:hypothetical protein